MVQGEEVTLADKRKCIRNAEEIRTEISKVLQILNENEFHTDELNNSTFLSVTAFILLLPSISKI